MASSLHPGNPVINVLNTNQVGCLQICLKTKICKQTVLKPSITHGMQSLV